MFRSRSQDGFATLFLQFENADWEKELSAFHDTDVPCRLK